MIPPIHPDTGARAVLWDVTAHYRHPHAALSAVLSRFYSGTPKTLESPHRQSSVPASKLATSITPPPLIPAFDHINVCSLHADEPNAFDPRPARWRRTIWRGGS